MSSSALAYLTTEELAELDSHLLALVPDDTIASFGEWIAKARPEWKWDAPHFAAMQKVLDRVTAGEVKRVYFQVPIRHGKALVLDTPIPTPDGFRLLGDLVPGDTVFADDGKPCKVVALSPIFRERRTYRVTTDDGDCVIADEAHEWPVAINPGTKHGKGKRLPGRTFSIRETKWLADREARIGKKAYVAPAGPLDLPDADLPIDPYVLGAWLGDGTSRGGGITIGVAEREYMAGAIGQSGYQVSQHDCDPISNTILGLRGKLASAGLLNNKHIPAEYLRASIAQRVALLQGLVDTDGYVAKDGQVEYCTMDAALADQVRELVHSLGRKASLITGRASISGKDCGPKYRVMFYMLNAARMPRKASRCRDSVIRPGRYLSFAYAGIADTRCIEVDSPTHLFLCGRGMTPTRNTEHNTISYGAYRLSIDPKCRILLCSYNQQRAQKFSRDLRRLARSVGVVMSNERDAAGEWETKAGGGIQAVGAGAGVAGINANLILIDDPLGSRDDAESQAKRDQIWDWLTNDILARCEPKTAVVMTMSRWHSDDPAGRLRDGQAGKSWTVLDLPAEAEANDALGREEGEPLWPEQRGAEWLQEQREQMGAYGFASLLQGRPRPREGGMFKWAWWQLIDDIPNTGTMIRYWDLAGTEPKGKGHDPDYSAGVLACRMADKRTAIVDVERFRKSIAQRDAELESVCDRDLANYRGRIRWWIETEAGIAGDERTQALVRRLQNRGMPVSTEHPTGKKVHRAEPMASMAEAGNVVLCPGEWRDPFRSEAADFPQGKHDDQIDAAAAAISKLANQYTVTVGNIHL